MYTRKDAEAYIVEAIQNGITEEAASEYDVEAIANDLYDVIGIWNMDLIDGDLFWWAVQRHSLDKDEREASGDRPTTTGYETDQIADDLTRAGQAARVARETSAEKASERDALIIRAHRTGAFTQTRLAEMAGVNQQRISQLLAR